MTEEINHSYDGGRYAELIRNRTFLDDAVSPARWMAALGDGAVAAIALDKSQPLSATIATSLRVEVTQASSGHAGVANEGFWGIPVRPDTRYRASLYAKTAPGVTGPITAAIQSDDGKTTYASGRVSGPTQTWQQYEVTLSTSNVAATANARFVLTVERPGTIWFSLVSLFPPTSKNQANGFRPDLLQMLVDMRPKFLRFPGGNYLQGDQIADRFEWKEALGPLSEPPGHRRRGHIARATVSASTSS
jgi:alpha-N-arabinofuranosidase